MSGGFAEDMRKTVIENEKRLKGRKHLADIENRYSGNKRRTYPDNELYSSKRIEAFKKRFKAEKVENQKKYYIRLVIVIVVIILVGYVLLFRVRF